MVVYGAPDTLGASLDRMVAHAKAVSGAAQRALVVGDLPDIDVPRTPKKPCATRRASSSRALLGR